jgi:hypothetical protein
MSSNGTNSPLAYTPVKAFTSVNCTRTTEQSNGKQAVVHELRSSWHTYAFHNITYDTPVNSASTFIQRATDTDCYCYRSTSGSGTS